MRKYMMRLKGINRQKLLALIYILVLFAGIATSYNKSEQEVVQTFSMPASKKVIIIDAGHGGWEPCAKS